MVASGHPLFTSSAAPPPPSTLAPNLVGTVARCFTSSFGSINGQWRLGTAESGGGVVPSLGHGWGRERERWMDAWHRVQAQIQWQATSVVVAAIVVGTEVGDEDASAANGVGLLCGGTVVSS